MASPKETLEKTVTSVKTFWQGQSVKNRIIYIASFAAVLIVLVLIIVFANKTEYVMLYQDLDTEEASQIVALIDEAGYEYNLSGGNVSVPAGTENTIAMSLAQQGYPKSSGKYAAFNDRVGMFTTESENNEYKRQADEDKLAAMLSALEPVEAAQVKIDIPKTRNTVIEAYKQPPRVSATLFLKDGEDLSNKQVHGIYNLIKTSFAGLTEDNISVLDGYGMLILPDVDDEDVIKKETRKLKFKTDLENQIKDKIVELLTSAYGEDGFNVAVNMVLNFDEKVSEDTRYTPSTEDERGMLQEAKSENATGYTTADGGIVGVEVNADDTYPVGDTNGNGTWSENSVDNVYLVNTYKEQIEKEGYVIDSLSVSAVIYTDYLPDSTQDQLVRIIGNTASINPEMFNQVISVEGLPKFGETALAADEQKYVFGLTRNQLIILGAILLGILLILIIIFAVVTNSNKKKRQKFEKQILAANMGGTDEPLVDSFYAIDTTDPGNPDVQSLMDANGENSKEFAVKREIAAFARQRPEIVAQLLRTWMNETPEERAKEKAEQNTQAEQTAPENV